MIPKIPNKWRKKKGKMLSPMREQMLQMIEMLQMREGVREM